MVYRLLVLPPSETMRPETLEKIKSFVDAGLPVFGPLPLRSPSMQGYPACDAKVKELAESIGGRVLKGGDLKEALKLPPDVSGLPTGKVLFTHRQTPEVDIYFLSNQTDAPVQLDPAFRVAGKIPEIWHSDTGEIVRPTSRAGDGVIHVSIRLDARGSAFVVFRAQSNRSVVVKRTGRLEIVKATYEAADGAGSEDVTAKLAAAVSEGHLELNVGNDLVSKDPASRHLKQLRVDYVIDGRRASLVVPENHPLSLSSGTDLTGAWTVDLGGLKADFKQLASWPDRAEPDIKYYSGEGTYRTTFQASASSRNADTYLDLGQVESMAEVTLNGTRFPVLWKPPYRIAVGAAVRPGVNELIVRVVNVWHNRLVGDYLGIKGLAGTKVWATDPPKYTPSEALLPSGLIGPVRIVTLDPEN